MIPLEKFYKQECINKLKEKFAYKNFYMVPRLEKIVINMGLGEAIQNPKVIEHAVEELTMISGQRPIVRKARKSIAAFKLRAGVPIGCSVTLRSKKMYDFMTKLIHIAIPRIRDFRGLPRYGFDGRGNYTLGIKEQIIFPEIDYDKVDKVRGMNVTFVTTARTDDEARELLVCLGMPFRQ
ncbi:MAG: 50S ribosomal protein L5 [Deltaproteobacteria bacterium]